MTDTALTPAQEAMKAEYIRARGYWRPWTEGLLRLSPNFLTAYARYAGHPAAQGPLSPAMCELVYVALDGSATHLFESGLRLHVALALERGATPLQVVETLHLATAQGLDGLAMGVTLLAEELAAAGQAPPPVPPDALRQALKARYLALFGDWPAFCDALLGLDPEFFAVMLDLLACREAGEGLDDKARCLLSLALSACFTALDREATRRQIRRALGLGASAAEILQVLQMTAHLGVHACAAGVPALMEAMAARG
ncbi:carboxymuconolactone decarboxylase family protein [Roseomonas sp. GC11]|uniref:carboxymuconolactone decarboxylase family protein n=1 Tax=Roseomonas sp. GC11 TaxID=2950546 RepID=UPI002108DF28|nr:carboxymuconolactone decarboxylase family protein [Roseomonas sp. GC11]MCQ4159022.1 carboxymuconolactone decarboxylase family protein [Roseomonas sp. GC11]